MRGGLRKFTGGGAAARSYLEADQVASVYFLGEGSGLAERMIITPARGDRSGMAPQVETSMLSGDQYEAWVDWCDPATGEVKGTPKPGQARFIEYTVNCTKDLSIVAGIDLEVAQALQEAQAEARRETLAYIADSALVRKRIDGKPQRAFSAGRIEAVAVKHQTSRAGDPHFHEHVQVSMRAHWGGSWCALWTTPLMHRQIQTINALGEMTINTNKHLAETLAAEGYHFDPRTGTIKEVAPYVAAMSKRHDQVAKNLETIEAAWRQEHRGEEPGRFIQNAWQQHAWNQDRPRKEAHGSVPIREWKDELVALGFTPPTPSQAVQYQAVTELDQASIVKRAVELVPYVTGSPVWSKADLYGVIARLVQESGYTLAGNLTVQRLTDQAAAGCLSVLDGGSRFGADLGQVRHYTDALMIEREQALRDRFTRLAETTTAPFEWHEPDVSGLDAGQREAVQAIAAGGRLVAIEGAAGTGKSTMLAKVAQWCDATGCQYLTVTPTLKAANAAQAASGREASGAHKLAYQCGYRWDEYGRFTRPRHSDELTPGTVLVVDEAGMAERGIIEALAELVEQSPGSRLVLVGDRRQLQPVGMGGGFDLAADIVPPVAMSEVYRFQDPEYAATTLAVREAASDSEIHAAAEQLALNIDANGASVSRAAWDITHQETDLVICATRAECRLVNSIAQTFRNVHDPEYAHTRMLGSVTGMPLTDPETGQQYQAGEDIFIGDPITTRENNANLQVANRDVWEVVSVDNHGGIRVRGLDNARQVNLPADYVREHVELAYSTTIYGAQGMTVDRAEAILNPTMTKEALYVAITRGRLANTLRADPPAEVLTDTHSLDGPELVKAILDNRDAGRQWAIDQIENVLHHSAPPATLDQAAHAAAQQAECEADEAASMETGPEPEYVGVDQSQVEEPAYTNETTKADNKKPVPAYSTYDDLPYWEPEQSADYGIDI